MIKLLVNAWNKWEEFYIFWHTLIFLSAEDVMLSLKELLFSSQTTQRSRVVIGGIRLATFVNTYSLVLPNKFKFQILTKCYSGHVTWFSWYPSKTNKATCTLLQQVRKISAVISFIVTFLSLCWWRSWVLGWQTAC